MNATVRRHDFADRLTLADKLAHEVAEKLREAIAARGHATLAVSGGGTPKVFFAVLARSVLDWSKVTVTLVDERWVGEDNERSNARMVRDLLLKQNAEQATFVPLYENAPTPDDALDNVNARIDKLPQPFDVVLLGMGPDGHTASFFPGGDHLAQALALDGTRSVLSMRAEGAGEPRITLSLPRILASHALYLHIEGDDKKQVLDDAIARDYPIASVLKQTRTPLDVYWSP
ncbi:6-phosphogluconolactonase [Luteibacter rhizovicinus]|uniref:6-phosphogluconolactonase n=1 Tax=Luteibacter rhizovicinus TaxID=242606 RepID=A0A4R3YKQ6_9GAMM|nr:6-phosphogluconolactonase [Luteibacter rhizovicinus]TCV92781.1 6-phosphogluconolactonase [Luteibacter rhizovicinus]